MKELKKFLNRTTDLIYNFLEKVINSFKGKNNSSFLKTIIKLVVLVVLYVVVGLIAKGMVIFGSYIIYQVGTTAREILSNIWSITVNFTYFLFIIVSLYHLSEFAQEDDAFLTLSRNQKRDKETKKKVFLTLDGVINILVIILLIPIFTIDIGLLFVLGIMVGYLCQGVYLFSLFGGVLGLIIFFTTIIFLIKSLLSSRKRNIRSYVTALIISGVIVAGSSVGVLLETSNYKNIDSLTTEIPTSSVLYEYKIDSNKSYIIENDDYDRNISLVIDDDLGSYLDIVVRHYTTNSVDTSIKERGNRVKIAYSEELNLEVQDFEKLLNLGVNCLKEKTIYNYTLLKYAKIEVRVSRQYLKNIRFVDKNGREYQPNERSN